MARSGLSTFLFAPIEESNSKYGEVQKLAGAMSYKETLTRNSTSIYADNVKKIEDTSVTGGKIALEVDDDDPEIFAPLLGRKKRKVMAGEEAKEVFIGNSNDIPVPVGFGFIENEKTEAGDFLAVNFYPKITFAPYDKENATKKEQTDLKPPSVTGTIYNIKNGDYKYEKRCKTMKEALEILYALFGSEVPDELINEYAEEEQESE